MGLIARHIEAAGIPTTSLTSARDITESVNPPRAAFLDFPLGHTAGRVGEPALNRAIVRAALELVSVDDEAIIVDLPHHWSSDDDWKDDVMRVDVTPSGDVVTVDDRVERFDTPQYQSPADDTAAMTAHEGRDCLVCAGLDY